MAEKAHRIADSQHYSNVVNALLDLLQNGDEADRCYAALALGKIKDKTAIPRLIEKLRDVDVDVCGDAATALGDIGCTSAIPALLESLNNDPDGETLTVVVEALGKMNDPEATNALLNIVHICPAHIEELEDDWDYYWDIQLKAVQALGNMGIEKATPILLNLLQNEDGQDIESDILSALSKIRISGEAALIELAGNSSARTRRRAILALSNSASENSLLCIGNALTDPAPDVREQALVSLGKRKVLHYFSAILKLMFDAQENVRAQAMEIALQFSRMAGKSHALIDTIKAMIRDRHEKARITALNIFHNLLKEKENVESIWPEDNDIFDDDLLECLEKSLSAENGNEVIAAMRLLAMGDEEGREEMLCKILSDEFVDTRINREAALLLAETVEPTAKIIEALEQTITHENQTVRLAALTALDKMSDLPNKILLDIINPQIIEEDIVEVEENEENEELEEISEEEEISSEPDTGPVSTIAAIVLDNEDVAKKLSEKTHFEPKNIEETLEELPEDIQEFGQIVKDNMENFKPLAKRRYIDIQLDIRLLSIQLLSHKMDQDDVFEALTNILDDDNPEIRRAILASLGGRERGSVTDDIIDKIIDLAAHDNTEIRIEAVRTLGKLGSRDNIAIFTAASDDKSSEVRIQALRALEGLMDQNDKDIITHIAAHLKDVKYGVRRAAIEILTALEQQQELDNIIDTGFADGGALSADAGISAIKFGPDVAIPILLAKLGDVPSSAERRFIIEMMQGIYEN